MGPRNRVAPNEGGVDRVVSMGNPSADVTLAAPLISQAMRRELDLVHQPVHVVTNSLPVANLFVTDPGSDLVLVGGNICPRTGVAQGPTPER